MSDKENKEQLVQEVDLEQLEQVNGGSNPFADIKRVKVKEIDDELREKI